MGALTTAVALLIAAATLAAVNLQDQGTDFMALQNVSGSTPPATELNNRPIIGVLAQPPEGADCPADKTYDTYIAASYVKFAEMAGIRVVPVPYDIPTEELDTLLDQLNGFLFPGGGTFLLQGDTGKYTPYFTVESHIFETAKAKNDKGIHFPLFGTCLGFQSLMLLAMTPGDLYLDRCDSTMMVLNQTLINRSTTRTYADAPESLIESIETKKITYENHIGCVTTEHFAKDKDMSSFWAATSTALDRKGLEYINSVEARDYPFYAFQFHTEKNPFEWTTETAIPHSLEAIKFTQYLGDVFGGEVRKSLQKFPSAEAEKEALIYNYAPFFRNNYFEQTYCFAKPSQA